MGKADSKTAVDNKTPPFHGERVVDITHPQHRNRDRIFTSRSATYWIVTHVKR